ncbi:MAG: metallophosphoesterase [Clostridia bacterium]|nr:metallophosphoesterase [Clostridia bacterium]
MAVMKLILAGILALGQILAPVGAWISNFGEAAFFTEWSAEDEFTASSYIELKKTPGEDFVVLNLADVQLYDDELYEEVGMEAMALIEKLIEDTDPDLITLSGDNAWGTMTYLKLIELVDSYGIPWGAVMGNHDGQRCISEFWAAYHLAEAENSVFEFGPKDMGYGNYVINITENGKIVHSVYMMDTHNNREYETENGTIGGYDHLWENQMDWYEWCVKGTNAVAGKTVESTVIMHIPVVEYYDAWHAVATDIDEANGKLGVIENPTDDAYGRRGETGGHPPVNNGFFDLCKELGSTKNMIVGHDHVNDYSIVYQGIRLTYAVKVGRGCYFAEDMMGGTTLAINSDGEGTITQHYYAEKDGVWSKVN